MAVTTAKENAVTTGGSMPHLLISTIITAKHNEIALFGKTLGEVQGKVTNLFHALRQGGTSGPSGVIDTFLSNDRAKTTLTPEVLNRFERFKNMYNSTNLSAEAVKETIGQVDDRIMAYARTCKNGEMTTKGFQEAMEGMSLSAKLGSAAFKALAMPGSNLPS